MTNLIIVLAVLAAQLAWQPQTSGTTERLRGVSAVNGEVAWASGNNGTVIRTTDGGRTWQPLPVPGAESLDFRDIEAFSDGLTAFVLSIGSGDRSRIYKTADGGKSWKLQFTNRDPKAFYDAIAFWDRDNGLAVGDPVDGRFTVLRTTDGGAAWTRLDAAMPPALEGDGAFAASGTILVASGRGDAWFGSGGGARARVFHTKDRGNTWTVADTPIVAGTASSGVFSIAFFGGTDGVAVGGDYRKEREQSDNIALTSDGGATWSLPGSARLRSFRSAVAYVPGVKARTLVAVGPAGSDISRDGGRTWSPLADDGFHALSIASDGVAWAVGEKGAVARLALLK